MTYGRSGSTLLKAVIETIDGYRIRGENNNALYGLYLSWKAVRRTATGHAGAQGSGNPWDGAAELRPKRYRSALMQVFIDEVLRPQPGQRVIGFKEIRWFAAPADTLDFLEFVKQGLHPVRFVLNSRRATDVAASSWWAKLDRQDALARIQAADAAMDAFAAANPDICHRIRYDDFAGRLDHARGK